MSSPKIIVVGGGLAGLMASTRIAEAGGQVELFSIVPVKRSHSVCAQGGINASKNLRGEGDSPWIHFEETILGGDFLANQPLVKRMCDAAPGIVDLMDRMGVMFNRTAEGLLDFRQFGGTKFHRTAFAGATTGQQLLYALDDQVRRYEVDGLIKKFEGWEFLSAILDDKQICRGIVAMDLESLAVKSFPADAVIIATGGLGLIFGQSTNSVVCTGSAQSALYQQGVIYANGEFIQVHPTAIPGEDKLRLMSESARSEGGRMWTYKDGKPWYFLEEWYPKYGNLVPRDIATRAIYKVVQEMKLGIDGQDMVYLDLSHINPHELDRKLGGILEIYEKYVGDDPRKVPMKVYPGVHYTMGGIWVDQDNLMSNVPGLFAAGECNYQHHGANRLGANSLVSAIFDGMISGPSAFNYASGLQAGRTEASSPLCESERRKQEEINQRLLKASGTENPFRLGEEMGKWMRENVTVFRYNDKLKETGQKLLELLERYPQINILDGGSWANQSLPYARELYNMLQLARVITLGALERNESRGAHYKPDFPNRDDEQWLKTTKAAFDGQGPVFSYEDVDISLLKPRARSYA